MLRRLRRRRPRWRDGEKLRHGFFDDLLCRFDLVDQTGRLSGERGRSFHVAVEIDVSNCLQRVQRHQAIVMDRARALRLQRADARCVPVRANKPRQNKARHAPRDNHASAAAFRDCLGPSQPVVCG
jgi:hypothetical protein